MPKAKAARQSEWDRLRTVKRPDGRIGAWEESEVQELPAVRRQARDDDVKIHIGRIFDFVVEKNSELPADDVRRKYKGRAVFEGSYVKDESGNWAIFQDLGSNPSTMEAARAGDPCGCLPGHNSLQCNAEQAYTQAFLDGVATWVRLPRDQWPQSWIDSGMVDPVVPLKLALYGHPVSGDAGSNIAINTCYRKALNPYQIGVLATGTHDSNCSSLSMLMTLNFQVLLIISARGGVLSERVSRPMTPMK